MKYLVEIINCVNPDYWYGTKIGERIIVKDDKYLCTYSYKNNKILKEDCKIIEYIGEETSNSQIIDDCLEHLKEKYDAKIIDKDTIEIHADSVELTYDNSFTWTCVVEFYKNEKLIAKRDYNVIFGDTLKINTTIRKTITDEGELDGIM